jgi:alkanesulfonate monooxygenase SsuD/methylene tetrahydromethanopterin reductase-like flavin-dependent oxidoreductase (luciferase family)
MLATSCPPPRPSSGSSSSRKPRPIRTCCARSRPAERGGLDLIGIQDHPYQRRFLDTFALIADLLARTERLRIFPDVANLPLRPPAMLAKAGASLDVMSGGRFELGLGAGAFWDAIAAMGGPARSPGESVDALAEAIEIWLGAYEPRMLRLTGRVADGWRRGANLKRV